MNTSLTEPPLTHPRTRIYAGNYQRKRKSNKLVGLLRDLQLNNEAEPEIIPPALFDGPPHPGKGWTRFVCISDTHSSEYPIPRGDVLLHAGDLSSWGQAAQLQETVDWIAGLEGFQVKILIAGNHDLCLDEKWCKAHTRGSRKSREELQYEEAVQIIKNPELEEKGVRYLEHERLEFTTREGKKWVIYGSPATPQYALGAFQYKKATDAEGAMVVIYSIIPLNSDPYYPSEVYKRIPDDTNILLTHTPAHKILDTTKRGKAAGCRVLKDVLDSGRLKDLRLHVVGHIHEANGAELLEDGRAEVNAAVAWGGPPVIVDLKN